MEATRVRVMPLRLNPVQSGDAVSSVLIFLCSYEIRCGRNT